MRIFFNAILFSLLFVFSLDAQVSVLTQHNDLGRTGMNLNETELTTKNVDSSHFGKLFERHLDDQEYAQPLIVSHLKMNGYGYRNVVYLATNNNSVYAFDADDMSDTLPYWHMNFTPAGTKVPYRKDFTGACGGYYADFSGNVGIVGTPVIDTALRTMFFVSRDIIKKDTVFEEWFHAINIITGQERPYSPVKITAKYKGNGDGSVNDSITFDPERENQRAAITLVKGVVYVAWASHCDWGPYHGWVIGFDEHTLKQKCVWMDNPEGYNAGIWMSGQGISADSTGNLYLTTGNGSVGYNGDPTNTINRGESVLKLTPAGKTLRVVSFFTPEDFQLLEDYDVDLGSAGVLLIPNTNWAVIGGKEGKVYLLNRDTMGGVDTIDHIYEKFSMGAYNQLHVGPVFYHSDSGDFVYIWPAGQYLYSYKIDYKHKLLDTVNAVQGPDFSSYGQPGGIMSVTANGHKNGTGILWTSSPTYGDANQSTVPGTLRAYDAMNIKHQLWNSDLKSGDAIGNFGKFVAPTVANGRVYMATFSQKLDVFGVMPPKDSFIASTNNVCTGTPISFTDKSDSTKGGITARYWDFGDGGTSTLKNPVHTYAASGNFWVTLSDSAAGTHNVHRMQVTILAGPPVSFRAYDTLECLTNNLFTFVHDTSSADTTVTSRSWNFGDGATATADSVTHSYTKPGNYSVTLKMTNKNGCNDSIKHTIRVAPILSGVNYTINDSAQCINANHFLFTNNSTLSDTNIVLKEWNFGDGSTLSNSNKVYYQYKEPGAYKVSLTMADAAGCIDSIVKTVYVYHLLTGANFHTNDSVQCFAGNSFLFINTSKPNDSVSAISWNFGDGHTSSATAPVHTYTATGYYQVTLKLYSPNTCGDSILKFIQVLPSPSRGFSVNDTGQCLAGNSFIFTDTSAANSAFDTRKWAFGDGQSGTGKSVAHSYIATGDYKMKFKIISTNKCSDSSARTVHVYAMPSGILNGDTSVNVNDTAKFVLRTDTANHISLVTVTGGVLNSQNGDSVKIVFTQTGSQVVTTYFKNKYGCLDSSILNVKVSDAPSGIGGAKNTIHELHILPNPNNGSFKCSFSTNKLEDVKITVKDVAGKELYSHTIPNVYGPCNYGIDLKTSGEYILTITTKNDNASVKIIVK